MRASKVFAGVVTGIFSGEWPQPFRPGMCWKRQIWPMGNIYLENV